MTGLEKKDKNVPLRITTSNYWKELRSNKLLPYALVDCLVSVVNSHIHSTIGPTATLHLIRLAKQYIQDGIILSDTAGDLEYDVMVFHPNREKMEELRSFFKLIPKYPGGKLRYLDELFTDI